MKRRTFALTIAAALVLLLGVGAVAGAPPGDAPGQGETPPGQSTPTDPTGGDASGAGGDTASGTDAAGSGDGVAGTGVTLSDLLTAALWGTTVVFGAVALVWVYLVAVKGRGYETPEAVHGGEDVQVRILTIDAGEVVQRTVDALPAELDDRHVIAEEPIDVEGATVHVVPDDFDCEAVRKGRAIEWARRHLDTDREFVCYLDEDSIMEEFGGLPDADVVQLKERPQRTGSALAFLADAYRMGVQLEQRAFASLSIPLFAWGGGIAVRSDLEDAVTWDRETLVEDTAFVWAAARRYDIEFELADVVCRNQAPPSFREILEQRRRWAAGNHQEAARLPLGYRLLTRVRNYAWALSPVVTVVSVPLALAGVTVLYGGLFTLATLALVAMTVFWYVRGLLEYDRTGVKWLVTLPLLPLVSVVHSAGTVMGIVDPPEDFRVTEKVT